MKFTYLIERKGAIYRTTNRSEAMACAVYWTRLGYAVTVVVDASEETP